MTLAASAAAVLAVLAVPALAQPPGYQPGVLPLPPGYRPRNPPPQAQQQSRPTPSPLPSAGGGKVMYFQKPADALVATGGPGSSTVGAVAQASDTGPAPAAFPVPDAPVPVLPPPPTSRYLPPDRDLVPPPVAALPPVGVSPTRYQPQPDPKPIGKDDIPPITAQKKQIAEPPGGASVTKLPPRESIFMAYDDAQLEKAIMDRIREDLKRDGKYTPDNAAAQEAYLVFPTLPAVAPPGVGYRPKTWAYEPRKVLVEPGYVVHRRLHFEERNAERSGWDLGPLSTLVGAAHFYRDVLMWPQSLASGCVYGFWSTSAGKCLPGSPSPYYLYPPGLTVTGSVFEAGVITGSAFFLP